MKIYPLNDLCKDKLREFSVDDHGFCDLACFDPGETVIREGDELYHLFLILKGKARIFSLLPNGKELTLMCHESEGVLGDWEFLTETPIASASIIAETPLNCVRISYKRMDIENIAFVRKIASESIERTRYVTNNYVTAVLQTSEKRICMYILKNYPNGVIVDYLTLISKATGVSYRQLLRIIRKLCIEKVLEKSGRGYHITDFDKLRSYCQ